MEVNGVKSICPKRNCHYEIKIDGVPIIESYSESKTGLLVRLSNYDNFNMSADILNIEYGGSPCNVYNLRLPDVECSLPKNADGSFVIEAGKPLRVHVLGIGYAIFKEEALKKAYKPVISAIDAKKVRKN